MKKIFVFSIALGLALALVQAPAEAQTSFGFKLTGGLAYVNGGDVNTGLQGWSDIWDAIFGGSGYSISGGYAPFHLGMDFGGEFLVNFSPSFGLGLGAGYIQSSKSSALNISDIGVNVDEMWAPKVGAIPLTLTAYYTLPTAGKVKFILNAGAGYYLGTYKDTQHVVFFGDIDQTFDTTASGLGFHGGFGIEVPFSPMISFLFEARGRYASLGSFKGTVKIGSTSPLTGDMWYSEIDALGYGYYPVITIEDSEPSGSDVRSVRMAKLGLSGFSAVLGFVFHFGAI